MRHPSRPERAIRSAVRQLTEESFELGFWCGRGFVRSRNGLAALRSVVRGFAPVTPDIASYNIYTIRQSILGHFDLNPLKPKVRFDASRALLMPFRRRKISRTQRVNSAPATPLSAVPPRVPVVIAASPRCCRISSKCDSTAYAVLETAGATRNVSDAEAGGHPALNAGPVLLE